MRSTRLRRGSNRSGTDIRRRCICGGPGDPWQWRERSSSPRWSMTRRSTWMCCCLTKEERARTRRLPTWTCRLCRLSCCRREGEGGLRRAGDRGAGSRCCVPKADRRPMRLGSERPARWFASCVTAVGAPILKGPSPRRSTSVRLAEEVIQTMDLASIESISNDCLQETGSHVLGRVEYTVHAYALSESAGRSRHAEGPVCVSSPNHSAPISIGSVRS